MDLFDGSGAVLRGWVELHLGLCGVERSMLTNRGGIRVYCDFATVSKVRSNDVTYWVGVPRALDADYLVLDLDDETFLVMPAREFIQVAQDHSCTGNDREWHPNIRSNHDRDQFWWTLDGVASVKQLSPYLDRGDVLQGADAARPMDNGVCPRCGVQSESLPVDIPRWTAALRRALPPRLQFAVTVGPIGPRRGEPTGRCPSCNATAWNAIFSSG